MEKPKATLIIETSGSDSFVAISDSKLNREVALLDTSKQSSQLMPQIKKIGEPFKIEAIAIGIGPGSYTGTRVGIITAKAISFSLKRPLIPFCSLLRYLPPKEGSFSLYGGKDKNHLYLIEGKQERGIVTHSPPTLVQDSDGQMDPSKRYQLNLDALICYIEQKRRDISEADHSHIKPLYSSPLK